MHVTDDAAHSALLLIQQSDILSPEGRKLNATWEEARGVSDKREGPFFWHLFTKTSSKEGIETPATLSAILITRFRFSLSVVLKLVLQDALQQVILVMLPERRDVRIGFTDGQMADLAFCSPENVTG